MRVAYLLFSLAIAAGSTACLRKTEFRCTTSAECGAGGTCQQDVGFCSFSDGSCGSSQRFSDSAGTYANQCVDGSTVQDAGVDSPLIDAPPGDGPPIDTPMVGCPGGYNTITGGQTGHKYRLLVTTDNWQQQRDFCVSTSATAYLAIPDTTAELDALTTLAASSPYWIGISDLQAEGTWRDTKNNPAMFNGTTTLPWDTGAPDDAGPGEDCVHAIAGTPVKWNDDRCNTQLRAICECEP